MCVLLRYLVLEGNSAHSSLVLCCNSEVVADELKPLCFAASELGVKQFVCIIITKIVQGLVQTDIGATHRLEIGVSTTNILLFSTEVMVVKTETSLDSLHPSPIITFFIFLCTVLLLEQSLHHPYIFYGGGCMETFLCHFLEEKVHGGSRMCKEMKQRLVPPYIRTCSCTFVCEMYRCTC